MGRGGLRPAGADTDLDEDVLRRILGELHEHVEIAIAVEDTCVQQLVFHIVASAMLVRPNQVIIRKGCLRVLVQVLHVRTRWCAVQVEVILLDVLTVVTLAVGQAKETILEGRVLLIPRAQQLLFVTDACKAILAPVIRPGPGVVMSEVLPGISILAVVLTNCSTLPLTEVLDVIKVSTRPDTRD